MRLFSSFVLIGLLGFSGAVAAQTPGTQFVAGQNWFTPGFTGDGGLATNARINKASGGSFDTYGNFFFADTNNHRIRKISSSGVITTVVGNGTAAFAGDGGSALLASLKSPTDVLVLPSGELAIADGGNGRIRKVLADGTIQTIVGGGSAPLALEQPALSSAPGNIIDLELSPEGEIWFSVQMDRGSYGTLHALSDAGTVRFPHPGLRVGGFKFSPSGRFYGTGARLSNSNTVFSVSATGQVTNLIGYLPTTLGSDEGLPMAQAALDAPWDVEFDSNGMLYVVDNGNHRIVAVGGDGLVRRAVVYANPAYPAAIVFGGGFPGFHVLQSVFILRTTGLPGFSSAFEVASGAPEDQGWFSSGLDVDMDGCARGCNPVDLTSGAKLDYALDYQNASPFPIVWDRRYDSRSGVWVFGYERSAIRTAAVGTNPETATFKRPDSSVISFHRNGMGGWTANKDVYLGKLVDGPSQTLLYSNLAGEIEVYSATGKLVELRNHQGQKLVFTYHANGDLQKIEDDFGRHLDVRLTATTAGANPISVSDGTRQIGYTFTTTNARRLLDAVLWPDATQTQYLYDEAMVPGRGLLTGIVGRDNVRYATYTYSVDERVESSSHGAGEDLTVYTIYPGSSASVSWENGSAYFDLSNQTPGVEHKTKGSNNPCPNCSGASIKAVDYNARGSATSLTTFQGVEIQRVVSPEGLVLSETRAPGTSEEATTTYTWNAATRQLLTMVEPTVVNGSGHTRTTVLTYDGSNRLVNKVVSTSSGEPSRQWTWTYNANGQVLTKTDPVTGTTTYAYQAGSGNLQSIENALGHQVTFSDYTASGQPRKSVDANGLETVLTLNANEQVVEIKRGSATTNWEVQQIDYEPNGQVARIDQPDGTVVEFDYDAAHRLVEVRDNRGKLVFTLNNDGDVIKEEMFTSTGTLLKTEGFEYDYRRRLKASVDAQNKKTNHYYNDYSNVYLGPSDPEGETGWQWYTQYDSLGRPSSVSNDYYTRGYSFDKVDQLTSVHDGNWVFTHYGYNGFGELMKVDSPDGGLRTFVRSAAGLVVSNTDARGAVASMTHDALGRVLTVHHDGSSATGIPVSETQTFTYDTCLNGVGRVCSVVDHSGTTQWSYDPWGRVVTKTVSPAGLVGVSLVTTYAYNTQGALLSMTYPSGRRLDYTMDRGRVSQLSYDFQPILTGVSYRPMGGGVTGWNWALFSGGVEMSYDLNGRLSSIVDSDERNYLRDARGWIRAITDPVDANFDQLYTYKTDGSLIQADLTARPAPIDFTLDENFNIMTKTLGPLPGDVVRSDFYTNYSINNRPAAVWGSGFYYALTFDEMGNMLNNGNGLTLTYDAKGRMRTSARLGMTTAFAINALGQRVRKSGSHLSTGHRIYAYDEAGRLLGQYDGTGTALEEYVYLDGHRPVALVRNLAGVSSVPVIHPILTDHLGTPRKVLSPTGSPLWTWDAKDPYGHQAPDVLVGGSAFEFDLRFPGQIYDVETGLYHNGHRDYDPASGRYVQADPIGLEGGWNPYVYSGSNPILNIDVDGLKFGKGFEDPRAVQALGYLSKSSYAKELIDFISGSDKVIELSFVEKERNSRYMSNGVVEWNPNRAIYCDQLNNGISPATILLHELFHFVQQMNPASEHLKKMNAPSMGIGIRGPTNMLEQSAIGFENMAAKQLGELVRDSHYPLGIPGSQSRRYIRVSNPTGRIPNE